MLKWIGIMLAALLTLLMAAAVAVTLLFDPNDYKDRLADWVEQRTGRELSIEGNLALTLFPWLGVTTNGLTLSNAPGFNGEPFATVERLNVRAKLLPLLARRFEIGNVELDGLILNLARDGSGRGNWQDLRNAGSASGPAKDSAAVASLDNIQVAGLSLSNATIYWRQEINQERYLARNVALQIGVLKAGEPVDIQLNLELLSIEPQFKLRLSIDGSATTDSALDGFSASNLAMDFALADATDTQRASGSLRASLAGSVAQRTVTIAGGQINADLVDPPGGMASNLTTAASWSDLQIDLAEQTLKLAALTTTVGQVKADWTVQAGGVLDGPELAGSVTAVEVPWSALLALVGRALPDGVSAADLDTLDLSSSFSYSGADGLTLSNARIDTLGLQATAAATIQADGGATGHVAIPEFGAAPLMQAVGALLPADVDTGAIQQLALETAFERAPESGDTTLESFSARLLGADLTGRLQISGPPGARRLAGTVRTSAFDTAAVARAFSNLLPENLDPQELGTLSLDSRFDYTQTSDELMLEELDLRSLGLHLTGTLAARPLSDSPTWRGRLAASEFSPRDLMIRFGQEVPTTADPQALSRATAVSDLAVDANGGQFKALRLNLDDSVITGDFRVTGYQDPAYAFSLSIDKVNVDRYLPPGADQASKQAGEVSADQVKVPVETLQTLRLNGDVQVGGMQLANLRFTDVVTGIKSGPDGTRLEETRAKLYGGQFEGGLTVDTQSRVPGISLKGNATTIQLEPLLVALRGESMISGAGSFQLDLNGRGETVIENVRSATGSVDFALRDGAVNGFNLGHGLCRAYNAQQRLPAPTGNVPNATRFTLIRGAARVTEGMANSRSIQASSAFLTVNGSGALDLAGQGLNYDLSAELSGPIAIEGCNTMDGLIGQSIPFTLRGTISDPKIAPDFGKLLEQTIRRRVEEEIKDKLLERLGIPRPSTGPAGESGGQTTTPR